VPLALAHRGDWSVAPENTIAAFQAAERAGADLVELDVRRTSDGAVVVVHDPTLERLWCSPAAVAASTLAEVRALRIDDHRVATLEEALASVTVPLMVDYADADVAGPALEVIREADALDRVLFSGGNVEGHRTIRSRAPGARIALTWTRRTPPPLELLEELDVEYVNPPSQHVDTDVVAALHDRGYKVSTWTVDDIAEMRRVLDAGVDAVITNRISELVALLAEARC
jgi:glycerophosphoryl diester phosphodiesterase